MTSPFKWILIQCTAKQTSLPGALTDRDIFSTKLVNYWIFQDNIFQLGRGAESVMISNGNSGISNTNWPKVIRHELSGRDTLVCCTSLQMLQKTEKKAHYV